jgi:hypothetical protein
VGVVGSSINRGSESRSRGIFFRSKSRSRSRSISLARGEQKGTLTLHTEGVLCEVSPPMGLRFVLGKPVAQKADLSNAVSVSVSEQYSMLVTITGVVSTISYMFLIPNSFTQMYL